MYNPSDCDCENVKVNIQGYKVFLAAPAQPSLLPQPRATSGSHQHRVTYSNHQPRRCKTLPSLPDPNGPETGRLRPHEITLVCCRTTRSIKKRIRTRYCCQARPRSFQARIAPSGMGFGWATTASGWARWPDTEVRSERCCQIGFGQRALRGDCYHRRGEAECQLGGPDAVRDSQQEYVTSESKRLQRSNPESVWRFCEQRRESERSGRSNQ